MSLMGERPAWRNERCPADDRGVGSPVSLTTFSVTSLCTSLVKLLSMACRADPLPCSKQYTSYYAKSCKCENNNNNNRVMGEGASSELDCTQSLSFLLLIETGASEMRDRARDWSEQGRRPRGEWGRGKRKERVPLFFRLSSPFYARICFSLAPVSQLLWTRKERTACSLAANKPRRKRAMDLVEYRRRACTLRKMFSRNAPALIGKLWKNYKT